MGLDRASELLVELGSRVVRDERYADLAWEGIAVVAIVDGGVTQMSGYSYDASGKATPKIPSDRQIFDTFEELRDAMQAEGKEPWKCALFQVKRSEMKVKMDFEYQDPMRWKVTPANINRMVEQLRPE